MSHVMQLAIATKGCANINYFLRIIIGGIIGGILGSSWSIMEWSKSNHQFKFLLPQIKELSRESFYARFHNAIRPLSGDD